VLDSVRVIPFEGSALGQLEAACHQAPRSSRGVFRLLQSIVTAWRSVVSVKRTLFVVGTP